MLPCSVRRISAAAFQPSILSSATNPTVVGLPMAGRRYASSQRRYSSSKPSRSDNGSKKASADDSVAAPVERPKSSQEKKKRKAKGAKSPMPVLPSVPNTNHVSAPTLALTSFFSLYRPISVTDGFPATVTDGKFASIFASNSSPQTSDVVSTLSDTIDRLEQLPQQTHTQDKSMDDLSTSEALHQQVENVIPKFFEQLNAMSGTFSPFKSPPAPRAVNESGAVVDESDVDISLEAEVVGGETAAHVGPGDRLVQYKAIITIDQITKPDGAVDLIPHPEVVITPAKEDRLERRRRGWNAIRWYLISVKRIRKLKMKKKKYRKLMKRTRNIRRKLDRL